MIVDYFANFCDSGYCANGPIRCTYPIIKQAPAENLTGAQLQGTIKKIVIEVDARDKFHYTYEQPLNWICEITIDNKLLCTFEIPSTNHVEDLSYTILNPEISIQEFSDTMLIGCKLYAGPFVACPYALDLIIYTEE